MNKHWQIPYGGFGFCAVLLLLWMPVRCVQAAEPGLGLEDNEDVEVFLEEVGLAAPDNDYDKLNLSHLSNLTQWEGVKPRPGRGRPASTETGTYHWAAKRNDVTPLDSGNIFTLIRIPEAANYRIFLRHQLDKDRYHPVTLTVTDADGNDVVQHCYGKITLRFGVPSTEQEQELPIRFEKERLKLGMFDKSSMVWEYHDVNLEPGVYRFSLRSNDKAALATAVFITTSKSFRPSLAEGEKTLDRVFIRYRLTHGLPADRTYGISGQLRYHHRRPVPGPSGVAWAWSLGEIEAAPAGTWTEFLDITEAVVPGPGKWSSAWLYLTGVTEGTIELQLAWYPHAAAVQKEVELEVYPGQKRDGAAWLRLPHGAPRVDPSATTAAWGMWPPAFDELIHTRRQLMQRYLRWTEAAEADLGLTPEHPRTRAFRLMSSACPGSYRMLARLGVNWMPSAPAEVVKRFGLFDETMCFNDRFPDFGDDPAAATAARARMLLYKGGDEISTYYSAASTNRSVRRSRAFHQFLEDEAKRHGLDKQDYLGLSDFTRIEAIDQLPLNPGVYERRLYYASQRFGHLASVPARRRRLRELRETYPNVHVYNNYSPHPVFLTGTDMNHGDWFVLCRNGAQNLGWGEDWAYRGSWGLYTHYQATSYYAALVACATRKHGYPGGFYVGVNCGGGARKLFACIGQGLTWLRLYDWGPLDAGADGRNFWSDNQRQYRAVMAATCALGPADDIFRQGRREPARTAILYNRSHEIWHGGTGRMNHDWMWTYIALRNRQIPVDVIIEEDLSAESLRSYDVLYLGGFNLSETHLAAVSNWVSAGGLLVGTAGAAVRTAEEDAPLPGTADLFGTRQTIVLPPPRPRGTEPPVGPEVRFAESELLPAATFIAHAGVRAELAPTTGKVVGTFADGTPAAVLNRVGEGRALLLGFLPGRTYAEAEGRTGKRAMTAADQDNPNRVYRRNEVWMDRPPTVVREWLAAPVLRHLDGQTVEYSEPRTEATVFTSDAGVAVLLASFAVDPSPAGRLSVKLDRPVTTVKSSLQGELEWRQIGGRIEVEIPGLDPVDVIIFR
ncbi:MAG: beta-galactosidase trimerization domain-containing protein [Planctomycetes bacterium]|nr:beta-galactosidase trimerization domain-containing protein [Planctomycetota bacterium]